jgi:hypothetical protein
LSGRKVEDELLTKEQNKTKKLEKNKNKIE